LVCKTLAATGFQFTRGYWKIEPQRNCGSVLSLKKGKFMATRLYVGGLSFSTSEDEIMGLFSQVGEVKSCRLVRDRDSNQSRGFAFVEMASEAEARQAISRFDGYQLDGRKLAVNEARERGERGGGRGGFGGKRY
jgi:RNA recognition motif-containing protein